MKLSLLQFSDTLVHRFMN